MRKKMFLIIGILSILFVYPFGVTAKSLETDVQPQKGDLVEINGNKATVLFSDIGYRGRTLSSPYDVTSAFFSTPLTWKLIPGGIFELHYDLLLSGADANKIVGTNSPYGGQLLVTFNKQVIGTIPLNEVGSHTARFELPAAALTSLRSDGRHQLTITLDTRYSCDYSISARVVIDPTSFFELFFEESSPELNLSRLPVPFYRANSFIPESSLVVIPDSPSALEMQAALNVISGFGSMIGGAYSMDLITASQLAGMDPTLYNMIFIGTPDQLGILSNADLQMPISGGKFVNLPPASEGDGVLQMALSPWNPNKVIMLVGGNSSEAVIKAAEAVSSGRVFIYENPALAFVSNIQLLSETLPVVEDFTFENLGYITETLSGIGTQSQDYTFYAGKEQVITKDGYIELIYYHSGLMDYSVSAFSVELNGQVIAGVPFSKETEQVTTLHIKIPPGTLRYGENKLSISASLVTQPSCDVTGFTDPWLTISSQSMLHLPAVMGTAAAEPLLKDLKFFPELFVTHSDLGDVAFVFSKTDVASWKIAGKLAYELGTMFTPVISNLKVAYADDVPEEVYNSRSLVVLGLASELPFLSKFNDLLPAPFDVSNNTASERQMQVVYRIPDGVSVGYLQLMLSPFNQERSILVVSGNNQDGLLLAGNGLLVDTLNSQLAGVFAVTNGIEIATGNVSSPYSVVDEVVQGAVPVNTTPIPSVLGGTPPATERPVWLFPSLVASFVIIVLVLGYVAISSIIKKRQEHPAAISEGKPAAKPDDD